MNDQQRNSGDTLRETWRTAIGMLGAIRDEVEHQIEELRARGDFTPERARETMRKGMDRAQQTMEQMRERLDFVPRREFEELRAQVAELRRNVETMRSPSAPPEIPAELE